MIVHLIKSFLVGICLMTTLLLLAWFMSTTIGAIVGWVLLIVIVATITGALFLADSFRE